VAASELVLSQSWRAIWIANCVTISTGDYRS
jgi:hypothetical protein